ncbi:MAG: cofactor-independent phosphoglycerate mutase [Pirellulales bacterium]|nr:cofactor-independent phosphoglycerate mutase [Pirellulales bacterium]
MKLALIIPDGAADEPRDELAGKTPLQAAHTPHMDAIATQGVVGRACHVPSGFAPGSDVANLSLLGYSPTEFFTGRAPLEAAAAGIELGELDWAVRCNLVTIDSDQVMQEFTAGHISSAEASTLLKSLEEAVDHLHLELVPGVSYRNLLIVRGMSPSPFSAETRTVPPHDLTGQTVGDHYPRGLGSDLLTGIMEKSIEVFSDHPVNAARRKARNPVASNVWLWGLGKSVTLPPFAERFGARGAMITAVDLLRGLAKLVGWTCIEVPGATGYLDTDYAAKGRAAIDAIEQYDFVCVHVEAPDEAAHAGDTAEKIAAIEQIDEKIVGPLHAALKRKDEYRVLVTPDHPTFLRTKTHSHGDVPFCACGAEITADGAETYAEPVAERSEISFPAGWKLMSWFTAHD